MFKPLNSDILLENGNTLLEDITYDILESHYEILEEIERGERTYMFKGTFARGNYANLNKRVYPIPVLGEAYREAKSNMEKGFMLVGENEHPQGAKLNIERISCVFPELTYNESTGELTGIAKPTDTPQGEILKGLMRSGVRVGFSTRAAGKVRPYRGPLGEGLVEVESGLRLIAIDAVMNPSAKCFPEMIAEGVESKYHFMSGVSNFKNVWLSTLK